MCSVFNSIKLAVTCTFARTRQKTLKRVTYTALVQYVYLSEAKGTFYQNMSDDGSINASRRQPAISVTFVSDNEIPNIIRNLSDIRKGKLTLQNT